MNISPALWDSDFLGIRVGTFEIKHRSEWDQAEIDRWELLYIRADPADRQTNEFLVTKKAGLVDRKTTYLVGLAPVSPPPFSTPRIRSYYSSSFDPVVINIGIQSSVYSRFNIDTRFPRKKAFELYYIWMQRSIKRELADEVFVCENHEDDIMGVITLGEKNERADIGILAVDEDYRGQKIGKELVHAAFNFAYSKGYSELQVVTQGINEPACRFYEHCGFEKEKVVNYYHYWRSEK